MNDYTPTTEEVREDYGFYLNPKRMAEFDRWLAEHDRQVAEKAYERGRLDERHDCNRYAEYQGGNITETQLSEDLRDANPYRKEDNQWANTRRETQKRITGIPSLRRLRLRQGTGAT